MAWAMAKLNRIALVHYWALTRKDSREQRHPGQCLQRSGCGKNATDGADRVARNTPAPIGEGNSAASDRSSCSQSASGNQH